MPQKDNNAKHKKGQAICAKRYKKEGKGSAKLYAHKKHLK